MKKADIRLRDLLTLVGPNTLVRVIDETVPCKASKPDEKAEQQTVAFGLAVKLFKDLDPDDGTMIKHMSPIAEMDTLGRYVFRVYVY